MYCIVWYDVPCVVLYCMVWCTMWCIVLYVHVYCTVRNDIPVAVGPETRSQQCHQRETNCLASHQMILRRQSQVYGTQSAIKQVKHYTELYASSYFITVTCRRFNGKFSHLPMLASENLKISKGTFENCRSGIFYKVDALPDAKLTLSKHSSNTS